MRALRPALAASLEQRLARITNLVLVAAVLALVVVLWPLLAKVGWAPFMAGIGLTAVALAHRRRRARGAMRLRGPVVAVATAMRNPGLALVIATVNKLPSEVVAVGVRATPSDWRWSSPRSSSGRAGARDNGRPMIGVAFQLPIWFDLGAVFLLALTGVWAAGRRGYDVVGAFIMAFVTGVGGGLLRDASSCRRSRSS